MTRLVLVIAALLLCTGCASRITGPMPVDANEDIKLARYIAEVQMTQADPDSWPEGWVK